MMTCKRRNTKMFIDLFDYSYFSINFKSTKYFNELTVLFLVFWNCVQNGSLTLSVIGERPLVGCVHTLCPTKY